MGIAPIALYLAGIAWTLHYDTIYAHQDRDDDALIGVRSTARLFGMDTAAMLWRFTALTGLFAASAVLAVGGGFFALIGVAAMLLHMVWQIMSLDIDDADQCLMLFRANRMAGLLLLGGLVLDSLF